VRELLNPVERFGRVQPALQLDPAARGRRQHALSATRNVSYAHTNHHRRAARGQVGVYLGVPMREGKGERTTPIGLMGAERVASCPASSPWADDDPVAALSVSTRLNS
jgi:hypothetical protein